MAQGATRISSSPGLGARRGVRVPVGVVVGPVPTSGFSSVQLLVSGQTAVTCSKGASATSYTCSLPTTYAPANQETVLGFNVTATSGVQVASTKSGTRYIDDLEACCRMLADNPALGRVCDDVRPGLDDCRGSRRRRRAVDALLNLARRRGAVVRVRNTRAGRSGAVAYPARVAVLAAGAELSQTIGDEPGSRLRLRGGIVIVIAQLPPVRARSSAG